MIHFNMENKLPALINELSATTIESIYAQMEKSSTNAVKALKKVTGIETDEQDEKVERLLVKVRNTYKKVETLRKGITGPMNDIKKLLMEPEKSISNAVGTNNEYERVKKLRDKYAETKHQLEIKRQQKIQREKDIALEKARIKNAYETKVSEGLLQANEDLNAALKKAFNDTTLETLPKLQTRMNRGAILREPVYNSWFEGLVNANLSLVPKQDVEKIRDAVKKEKPYPVCLNLYQTEAKKIMESWSDTLPELKEALKKGKEEAKKLAERASKEEEEKAKKAREKQQEESKAALKGAQLNAEFSSQIKMQEGEIEHRGNIKKRAILEASNEDLIAVISELFFEVFIHPKYTGIIKKDRQGNLQENEDGTPIYVDWFESLLNFYANNCEDTVPGIKIVDVVTTTQRKK